MKRAFLAAILAFAPVATASDLFGVYLVTTADSPGARKATLHGPGGAVEIVFLDSAPLLEASAIVAADVEPGPGGEPQIRLVLTPDGARKLAELTRRRPGGRVGIVVDGRLRAAPFVSGGMAKDLVVGGAFTRAEASALARKLGPPSAPNPSAAVTAPLAPPSDAVLRDLEGTWTLTGATMNGQAVPDRKFSRGTWTFSGGALTVTNGVGGTARFAVATDPGAPDAFRLDPIPPSTERAGWMIFRRERERLAVAFFDGFARRAEDFAPAPKKVVLEFSRSGAR